MSKRAHPLLTKTTTLIRTNWLQLLVWSLTMILLVITIILLVVWQTSALATTTTGGNQLLTPTAILQQNVIAAFAFSFVCALTGAIFTTVIIAYRKKHKVNQEDN